MIVPDVELIVKRTTKTDADEIGQEHYKYDDLIKRVD